MPNILTQLLRLSRPRFWSYTAGPYLLGLAAASGLSWNLPLAVYLVWGFFFLVPGNLFVYGINDCFDYETDKLNPKKTKYELLLHPKHFKRTALIILAVLLPFVIFGVYFLPAQASIVLLLWIFSGMQYSAPPIRAKAHPGLDVLFSSLIYILPGLFAYLLVQPIANVSWLSFLGALLWAGAMQTYSAVPDIAADTKAGVTTLATALGAKTTIITCGLMYLASGVLGSIVISPLLLVFSGVYVGLMAWAETKIKQADTLFRIYKLFPLVNVLIGMATFFVILFSV